MNLTRRHVDFLYEPHKLPYVPKKPRLYIPDFYIKSNKAYIEAKGYFTGSDRAKMLAVKEQYPDLKFYILFQNANNRLNKTSKTTYGMWATQHGFKWAEGVIPDAWLK